MHEGHQRGGEVGALGGQPVFVADGAILVGHPMDDAQSGQSVEPIGQEVSCNTQVAVEGLEPTNPPKEVS